MSGKIMILAGEASGDLHGGKLVRALRKVDPGLEIIGVGGDKMAAEGMKLFYHINQLSYVGFTEVIRHYFFFRRVFFHLLDELLKHKPDVVVFIDYPGFNLRFAREAKKRGFRTLYYIAPQVWAWGQGRAKKMAKFIDQMAVIFPFEETFFSRFGIPTHFVGHPLLEGLLINLNKNEFNKKYGLSSDEPILAILPGSRSQEVINLLPSISLTVKELRHLYPQIQVVVSKAPTIPSALLKKLIQQIEDVKVVDTDTYELLQHATAGIVASGTATLETAIFKLPFIIVYRVSKLSFLLGKLLIKIPYIGLVNVVAGKKIIKEFLQNNVNPIKLVPEIERILFNEEARSSIRHNLDDIIFKLGEPGASMKTAQLILQVLNKK